MSVHKFSKRGRHGIVPERNREVISIVIPLMCSFITHKFPNIDPPFKQVMLQPKISRAATTPPCLTDAITTMSN